jgi:hypothetical protein
MMMMMIFWKVKLVRLHQQLSVDQYGHLQNQWMILSWTHIMMTLILIEENVGGKERSFLTNNSQLYKGRIARKGEGQRLKVMGTH